MGTLDRSIFRQRAIDRYMQRRELHVILRLVSPRMFLFLWTLLFLTVGTGCFVWTIQQPILVQGKGIVAQPKATKGTHAPGIVVLLLFTPDKQANLKVGQPVSISIAAAHITFNSTIQTIETGVMSPAAISTQLNLQSLQPALTQTLSGPAIVATAPVEPMALARSYLGSQCQVQVQVGAQSVLSQLPGYSSILQFFKGLPAFFSKIPGFFNSLWQNIGHLFQR
jgi:hypothetical protein